MDDVRQWLDSIGLGRYADAFEANDIEFALLPALDDAYLKELGVVSVGHRLRLRQAIAALGGDDANPDLVGADPLGRGLVNREPVSDDLVGPDPVDGDAVSREHVDGGPVGRDRAGGAPVGRSGARMPGAGLAHGAASGAAKDALTEPAPASAPSVRNEAEHRQLTVMFCDLVGSVALGERMDLEDYRALLARFRGNVVREVERFDGFIARHQGDGVLVYFGYPQAHEDDAARAVHAALAIVGTVTLPQDDGNRERLAVRIGIATGSAVVGDLLETGESGELAALGQTPNLAARLQGQADENEILISDTTRRLAGARFDYATLPSRVLKGFGRSIALHRVDGAFEEAGANGVTVDRRARMVGREAELALLHDRWRKTGESAGQVVHVCAEPGIGKSRLVETFIGALDEDTFTPILLQGSPYHAGTSLHPLGAALRRCLGDAARDEDGLRHRFADAGITSARDVALLAALIGTPMALDPAVAIPDGTERRGAELGALSALVDGLCERRPVLLIMEDAHWLDPSTVAWLQQIVELARTRPLMLMLTFRPEFEPAWRGETHLSELRLNTLTKAECRALVEQLELLHPRTAVQIEHIVERADGVPLFAEELWQSVVEAAEPAAHIPETLRDALTARLDRLGPAKDVARAAAVLGRVFPSALLPAVSGLAPERVDEALTALLRSGLVQHVQNGDGGDHQFKHALVRDTGYESMLRETRRRLHANAATALRDAVDGRSPDVLAHHFEHAELFDAAIEQRQAAGDAALQRGAYGEAETHFAGALALAESHGGDADLCVRASTGLAYTLHVTGRRVEADATLVRQGNRIAAVTDADAIGHYHRVHGHIRSFLGMRQGARDSFRLALAAAERSGDPRLLSGVLVALGWEEHFLFRLEPAVECFERAVDAVRGVTDATIARGTHIHALYGLAATAARLGRFRVAEQAAHEAAQIPCTWPDILSVVALEIRVTVHAGKGQWSAVIDALTGVLDDVPPFHEAMLHYHFAVAVLRGQDAETGIRTLEEALRKAQQYRSKQVQAMVAATLGHAYCGAGRVDDAQSQLEALSVLVRDAGLPDMHQQWLAGRIALERGLLDEARTHLERARAALRASSEIPAEARARLTQARTEHASGNARAALAHLRSALDAFTSVGLESYVDETRKVAADLDIDLEPDAEREERPS